MKTYQWFAAIIQAVDISLLALKQKTAAKSDL